MAPPAMPIDDSRLFAALLDTLPDFIYFKDADRRFVRASRSMQQLLGKPLDSILGSRDEDLFPPDIAAVAREDDLRVLRGDSIINQVEGGIFEDGTPHWVLTSKLPWRDDEGKIIGLYGISRDVTKYYRLNERLADNEAQLQKAQSIAHVGHWVLDARTLEVEGSDECFRIFGLDREEATLDHFAAVVHEEDREYDLMHIRRGLTEGVGWDIQHRLSCRDGTEKVVHAMGEAITAPDGQVLRLIGTVQDITERVRDEERRVQMIRELDHRVKNNLATVLSVADLTLARADSLDTFRSAFSGRILALAHAHEALAANSWKDFDFEDILRVVLAPHFGTSLTIEGPTVVLPPTAANPLCMVFHELATNASKHGALSTSEGTVALKWTCGDEQLELSWRETGGPAVDPAPTRGVGTRLIEGLIEHELGGVVDMRFASTGLLCDMTLPLPGGLG